MPPVVISSPVMRASRQSTWAPDSVATVSGGAFPFLFVHACLWLSLLKKKKKRLANERISGHTGPADQLMSKKLKAAAGRESEEEDRCMDGRSS